MARHEVSVSKSRSQDAALGRLGLDFEQVKVLDSGLKVSFYKLIFSCRSLLQVAPVTAVIS